MNSKINYGSLKSESAISSYNHCINPFHYKVHFTKLDLLKVILNTFWLLPLRLIALGVIIVIGLIICNISRGDSTRPLTGWKKFLIHRFGVSLNRVMLFALGFHRIRTTGQPASPRDAPIRVVAPHTSFFDVLLCCLDCVPTMVARAENRNVPVFGRVVDQTLKTIFVSRTDRNSRQECYNEIIRRVESQDEWPPVLIFPEGTTTNAQSIIHFKHGAFRPMLPVQPIIFKYKSRLNTHIWTETGTGVLMSLYLTACQFNNSVEIEYMPVYYPSQEEKDNINVYAENIQRLTSQSMGIPYTQHSFEDILLSREARRLGLPNMVGVIEYGMVARPYSVSLQWMKKLLRRFANADINKDGLITCSDLSAYLQISKDICYTSLFNKLDIASNGFITFREYALGLLKYSQPLLDNNEFICNTFNSLDKDSDGQIKRNDLLRLPFVIDTNNSNDNNNNTSSVAIESKQSCWYCFRPHQRRAETLSDAEKEEGSLTLLDLSGPWNYDQFKVLLQDNLEYMILFHEYQSAGHSNNNNSSLGNEIIIEIY